MLARRDKVSEATAQLNGGSINSVQQDMQPQTLVEEESQAEDMQTRALLEAECQSEDTQPQVSLEEDCQTGDATEIAEAQDCAEQVPVPTAIDETLVVSKDVLIQTQVCGESVSAQLPAEDMPRISTTKLTVPATIYEQIAVSQDGLIRAQDCGESVSSQITPEDMARISTTEVTEAEDCGERVPAPAAIPTVSTVELSAAYVLTCDSMPEFVEVDSSKEQSLSSNSSSAKKDLPTVKNSDGFLSSWMRNASWSHSQPMADNGFEPFNRMTSTRGVRRGRTADLEGSLSACRRTLEQLKRERAEQDALIAQLPHGQVGDHPLLEKAASLSARLTDLAAESLECGCNRDVPGAMDVYEQANAYLDAVSDLLQSFTVASTRYESETSDAAWPPLESHKSDETSTAPAYGLSWFLRVVGS